jgi:phospholipase C
MLPSGPSYYSGNLTLGSLTGPYAQPSKCLSDHSTVNPPIPYGPDNVNQNMSLLVEEGFKQVRGQLTEGRYLTFEELGFALSNDNGDSVGVTPASQKHEDIRQRWIIHAVPNASDTFYIQSALDGKYISGLPIGSLTSSVNQAQSFTFQYSPSGATYSFKLSQESSGFVSVKSQSRISSSKSSLQWDGGLGSFKIFSVSYH